VDDIACSSTDAKELAFGVDDVPSPDLDVGHFN
jgi:hypothetical protein